MIGTRQDYGKTLMVIAWQRNKGAPMSDKKPHWKQDLAGRFAQEIIDSLTGDASKDVLFLLQQLEAARGEVDVWRLQNKCRENYVSELQEQLAAEKARSTKILELLQNHAEAGNIENYSYLIDRIEEKTK